MTRTSFNPIQARLAALGITLPAMSPPAAAFVPFVQAGDLVFVSGHIAKRDGMPWIGQLGHDMETDAGRIAARGIGIELLSTLAAAAGDLERVIRIVKLTCLVNSAPGFTEHHLVANGCSELLAEVFGDRGAHARSAFGTAQLPMGACVEIEMIAQLN